jgi:hypothetical protein
MSRNKIGVGADGSHNAFAKRGEATLAVHHDPNEARKGDHGVKGNIARDGAPKRMHPVSVHNGMTRQQSDAAGIGGMGHATAVVDGGQKLATDAPAAPLEHAYGSGILKVRPAAQVVPGMRTRRGEIGPGNVIDGKNPAHEKAMTRNGNHDPAIGAAILASALCSK